jgi:hypothetical protein
MTIFEQHDDEFIYIRGSGTRRHREECYSNAQSRNRPIASGREPRCKMCEAKLEVELRNA